MIKRTAWILSLCLLNFMLLQSASANLCKKVRDTNTENKTKTEVNYYQSLFNETSYRGTRTWNEIVLECNRKRDTKGDKIQKIMTDNTFKDLKDLLARSDLEPVLVKGKYNFFGNIVTQQKYRYILSKKGGVWTMVIPYHAIINDVVKDRIDFYIGDLKPTDSGYSSTDKTNHAWKLYEASQVDISGSTYTLKSGAKPIAETLCGSTTFFEGKEHKYDNQNNENSKKRDRENKHISLGKIQYSYDGNRWKDGCRVKRDVHLYWADSSSVVHKVKPDDWILDNFIRTAEEYWSQPANFELKILIRDHNESSFSSQIRNLLDRNNDYIKVRFGTKFMPYGGNQVYKTSLIQFNNFSTMTTDGTYWHEVGHAFGLDDEYGGEKKEKDPTTGDKVEVSKTNDCEHSDYSTFNPTTYQMCNGGTTNVRTIYHYITTSRYVLSQICDSDADCSNGKYCNKRIGINRCLADGTLGLGASCTKDKECASGSCNKDKKCQCTKDSQCGKDERCDKGGIAGIGKNVCSKVATPTCKSGWTYEVRNPLNKDRCNKSTTTTAKLECKLLATDKEKNWTGPHAQKGEDECRSTKGKKPKGVKCPSGYKHKVTSGADTCTKTKEEHETPTCPSGYKYKSVKDKDECHAS